VATEDLADLLRPEELKRLLIHGLRVHLRNLLQVTPPGVPAGDSP
jgi:hypothetical protein